MIEEASPILPAEIAKRNHEPNILELTAFSPETSHERGHASVAKTGRIERSEASTINEQAARSASEQNTTTNDATAPGDLTTATLASTPPLNTLAATATSPTAEPLDTLPRERFQLLLEIAEELSRFKVGVEDKIKVAGNACDHVVLHQSHIQNLLSSSTLLLPSHLRQHQIQAGLAHSLNYSHLANGGATAGVLGVLGGSEVTGGSTNKRHRNAPGGRQGGTNLSSASVNASYGTGPQAGYNPPYSGEQYGATAGSTGATGPDTPSKKKRRTGGKDKQQAQAVEDGWDDADRGKSPAAHATGGGRKRATAGTAAGGEEKKTSKKRSQAATSNHTSSQHAQSGQQPYPFNTAGGDWAGQDSNVGYPGGNPSSEWPYEAAHKQDRASPHYAHGRNANGHHPLASSDTAAAPSASRGSGGRGGPALSKRGSSGTVSAGASGNHASGSGSRGGRVAGSSTGGGGSRKVAGGSKSSSRGQFGAPGEEYDDPASLGDQAYGHRGQSSGGTHRGGGSGAAAAAAASGGSGGSKSGHRPVDLTNAAISLLAPDENDGDGDGDADSTLYCYCQKTSFGEMIGCDNESCEIEWVSFRSTITFHTVSLFFLLRADANIFSSVPSLLSRPRSTTRRSLVMPGLCV